MIDSNLKRTLILDNFQNPINKGLKNNKDYIKINTNNESCIDEVNLMVKLEDNIIKDIRFDGEACAICTSSTSIMIKLLLNKNLSELNDMIRNFKKMINGEEYDSELLKDANVYNDIYLQPSRKTCALLPWFAIEKIIEVREND